MTNAERWKVRLGFINPRTPRVYEGPSNIQLVGAPRDHKFTSILAPMGFTYQGSMIYSDPKAQGLGVFGGYRKHGMGHRVFSLDLLGTVRVKDKDIEDVGFNAMQGLHPDKPRWAEDCRNIAGAIVVHGQHADGNARYFSETAESLIAGVIGGVTLIEPEENHHLVRVWDIIASDQQFAIFAQKMLATQNDFLVNSFGRFDSDKWRESNEMFSVLSTMRTNCNIFSGLEIRKCASRNMPFSFSQMRDEPIDLFVTAPLAFQSQLERLTRLVCIRAMQDFEVPIKNPCPVMIVADEVANTLARLPQYSNWLSYSAGLGVRFLSVWQFISQIVEAFPHNYQSVIGSNGIQIYFRPRQNFDADYLSEALGETEIRTETKNISYAGDLNWDRMNAAKAPSISIHKGQAARRLKFPTELRAMSLNDMIVFSEDYPNPIMGLRYPYFHLREFDGKAGADPFYFGS